MYSYVLNHSLDAAHSLETIPYFLACSEIKSSEWDTGPFARQVIEGVGLAHTLDILSSDWDTGTFRSTVYGVDGAQTQSLSTSSSKWACVPFTQQSINWVSLGYHQKDRRICSEDLGYG